MCVLTAQVRQADDCCRCTSAGRAAQKLQETCGDQDLRYAAGEGAVTIHRLLKCTGGKDQDRSAAQPGVDDEEEEDDLSSMVPAHLRCLHTVLDAG